MRWVLVLCSMLVAVSASAAEVKHSTSKSGKPRIEATNKVTAEATVLSVNKSKRTVKVRAEDGDTLLIECGPENKNFAQIKAKDVVTVTYTEKLTIEIEKGPATPSAETETTTGTAKEGEKPHASITQHTKYKATISAIDTTAGTVTLKGMDGREATVTPRNRANLHKVEVGDLVVFTYTENLAASVTTKK